MSATSPPHRALRALPPLAIAVGLFVACSQGPQATPASDAGVDVTASATWGASACADCVNRACSEERRACSSDSACVARVTCLERCPLGPSGDLAPACAAACPAGSGAATQAFESCRGRATRGCAACGPVVADAGLSPLADKLLNQVCAPGTNADACTRCQESKCCDTRAACVGNPACKPGLTECLLGCSAMPEESAKHRCSIACYEKDLKAAAELGGLLACIIAKCPSASECGPHDACSLCASERCASYYAECRATPECELISKCRLAECPPPGAVTAECTQRCEARYPGGARLARDEEVCLLLSCAQECR